MVRSRKSFLDKVMQATPLAAGDRVALPGPDGQEEVAARKLDKVCHGWCEKWHWDPDATTALANALFDAGKGTLAYELLRLAHKEFPKNIPLMFATAHMALAAELPDRAKFEYSELRKHRPNDENVIAGLALSYEAMQDESSAVTLLLEAIDQNPAALLLWETLLNIQLAHGVAEEVLVNFRGMATRYPEQIVPLLALARHHETHNDPENARRLLDQAHEKKSDDCDLLRSRLHHGDHFGDPDLARESGELLLALDLYDAQDLEALFKAHIALGCFDDAQGVLSLFEMRFPEKDILSLKRKLIVATRPKNVEES